MRDRRYRKIKKSSLKQIILSSAALLLILVLGLGITYSWIEGGTTYTMQSENDTIKTAAVPDSAKYHDTIYIDPNDEATLDISVLDETTTSALTFSPVSSKDGENFYFPVKDSEGQVVTYRRANTNDIGTKFIAFDFPIEARKNCYLAFAETPTITIRNSSGAVISNADTSPFRIMLSSNNIDSQTITHVFSGDGTEQTTQAVTALNSVGVTTKEDFTTKKLSDYVYNESDSAKRLFTFQTTAQNLNKGDINISVWLDSGADAELLEALKGCTATVNMKLKVVDIGYTINLKAVTYQKDGTAITESPASYTGGSIKRDSTIFNIDSTVIATNVTLTAIPKEGYEFMGWFTDPSCSESSRVGTAAEKELAYTATADVTLYARFNEKSTTTIYFEKRSGYSSYNAYVYQSVTGGGTVRFNGDWPGGAIAPDNETPYYIYQFTTSEVGKFRVIISDNESNQYPAENVAGLEGTLGGTYFFASGSPDKLQTLTDSSWITVKTSVVTGTILSNAGGTAEVGGVASQKLLPGGKVNLTASARTGYKFVGWYKDSTCTTPIDTNPTTANQTVTVSGTAGTTVTYYAKFVSYINVVAHSVPVEGGSATVNSSDSVQVSSGTNVTLNATPNTGYDFVGWYTDAACTSTIGENFDSQTVTVTPSGSPGATVNYYAKFEKKSSITTTIYFEKRSDFTNYYAYVYQKTGSATVHLSDIWPGTQIYLDAETPYYKYELTGSASGSFMVIINNGSGAQYPGAQQDGLSGELGGTYLFKSGTPTSLVGITDLSWMTINTSAVTGTAVSSTGGTAKVGGVASQKLIPGGQVSLTAVANSGYKFVGWYKDAACTTTIGSNYATANQTVSVSGAAGSTVTYYAKFVSYINVVANSTPAAGGSVTVNSSGSVQVSSGTSVTLNATPNTGYDFVGWYTNSACTTTIGTNYQNKTVTVTPSGSPGATVNYYAKFEQNTTKTIYFDASHWDTGGAQFGVHVWKSGGGSDQILMTKVSGTIYSCEVDTSKYTSIIFVRLDTNATAENIKNGGIWTYKWNQTADQTIPTDSKNKFTVTSGAWEGAGGSWSVYS
ncbi:MAG: InlB B-repeat-containing protein [Ruminococcus sp.]